ncbi:aminoglycoside phosphotransferase family protein [Isoptericola sp. b515]|uniref:aminoglycoside phosphotransferase family protein n=1 Tax=Isoptericola sp. b515 TaxID=3064652 RepID=UPI002712F954|nr:aminoglycoside phosphotransferase family protein [Isoptericola sp. b515]MDO8149600.1 aminoglycoside phosphotransferase family protein [Isoptericola sp. b515]
MTCEPQGPDPAVRDVVAGWLGPVRVVAAHSRGSTGTGVWQVRAADGTLAAVRRYRDMDGRFGRELAAHTEVLDDLTGQDRFPRLLGADREQRLLALGWLPGRPAEGHPAAERPETYRQAGMLLARLHATGSRVDGDWEAAQDARTLALLDDDHRIAPAAVAALRRAIAAHEHPPVRVVPTHGDFVPRRWLLDDAGLLRVVGFGRYGWRPPVADLARLDARELTGRADLRAAVVEGYGADPFHGPTWRRARLREAVRTAVRAHRAGARALEARGHRLIDAALADAAADAPAAAC